MDADRVDGIRSDPAILEVRDLGAAECFRHVRMVHPKVSLNLLWALEGAVTDCDWRNIDERRKRELRRAVDDFR